MIKNKLRKFYRKNLEAIYKFIKSDNRAYVINQKGKESLSRFKGQKYIILDDIISNIPDLQTFLFKLKSKCDYETRIVITYYNHLWEPILRLASVIGIAQKRVEQNWLDDKDVENFLNLSGFEKISIRRQIILPIQIPFLSNLINKWIAQMPIINNLCLTSCIIARVKPNTKIEYSVSIIVPARNEEGNISTIAKSIPKFGKSQEIIFVEGNSKDKTWEAIKKQTQIKYKNGATIKAYKQNGKGKADAVRLGFSKAKGEILMIYDADRTVDSNDLPKFYEVLSSGLGEFANGSRLVYPMEKDAMRTLNKIGNKIFSNLFTWILGQRFKDTLCGTKVLFKKDYEHILKVNKPFGDFDPFGDFELIFGAVKLNLKIVEIPVRYKERVYGKTNISRFIHGFLLLQMTLKAFKIFRSY